MMTPFLFRVVLLSVTTLYQAIACWLEDRQVPPGKLIDVGGYRLHLYFSETTSSSESPRPTLVLDHSLGGIEGYLLIEELAKLTRVCIYDRAGYGWSDHSFQPRTSDRIVTELDTLLTRSGIEPPYILIGDSFGSFNVRLYASRFPEKVVGMVLTDGLHETGMLEMPFSLRTLKLFFWSGFVMSILGSLLGIIRVMKDGRIFEILKPQLKRFPAHCLAPIKRSFCRPKHWITMSREIINLNESARQVSSARWFGDLPIVNIKANSFFQPSFWTFLIPGQEANRLRDRMHEELLQLSTRCSQIQAEKSGHFVWVDQPDRLLEAVQIVLD
jgi:pimeloyl-ACP methyl ester carboxylesterase